MTLQSFPHSALFSPEDVCAIVVTWNSPDEIQKTLPSTASQVKEAVIVDNGSTADNFKLLSRAAVGFNNVTLLRNEENLGIGAALNRGAKHALKKGYPWILTLDDNGEPEEGMVKGLLAAYNDLPPREQEKTAIVAPNYTNLKGPVYRKGNPMFVLTTVASGQLVKTAAWKKVGGYKENFFIACVDHEFSFRIGKAGYKILLVPSCALRATAGQRPEIRSFFGKKLIVPNYVPDRYYYTYRNSIYIYLTYFTYAPGWILKNIFSNFVLIIAKILFFENKKLKKISMVFKGSIDGIRNKYGKRF